ncbi:MAG: hypothetical protein CSA05_02130 [Bacteroidia bacterium]|nr:MAG: hypothetical protein CSA05_02130 [Bacteroidia bacterium]
MSINYSEIHKDVIEASKKGDIKAQYKLYQLYSRAMFNICYRMINSREEAEDLLQESFSEAFFQLERFRYESSFGAWLKRIVINKCLNELKRKKAELVFSDDFSYFHAEEDEPCDEAEMKYSVKQIHEAIGQLADGYRVIFSLYLLEGYDHAEIADIMGISESTSKSQYMRAKRKVIKILQKSKS